jgi:Tn3 transposase DDE domain
VILEIFHGQRGQLRKHYQVGQENQLDSLGIAIDVIVGWETVCMQAGLDHLAANGYPLDPADIARLPARALHNQSERTLPYHQLPVHQQGSTWARADSRSCPWATAGHLDLRIARHVETTRATGPGQRIAVVARCPGSSKPGKRLATVHWPCWIVGPSGLPLRAQQALG